MLPKSTLVHPVFLVILVAVSLLGYGLWIPVKAEIAQWFLRDAWQKTMEDGGSHKPWSWADHWPVARMTINDLSVDQVVLAGDSGNVLAFAPGYNLKSASLSTKGTIVISGHRDTHFRFMKDIAPGQKIQLQSPDGTRVYRVVTGQVVNADVTTVDINAGIDQLLLVTCYPFDSPVAGGPLRYIVTALPGVI